MTFCLPYAHDLQDQAATTESAAGASGQYDTSDQALGVGQATQWLSCSAGFAVPKSSAASDAVTADVAIAEQPPRLLLRLGRSPWSEAVAVADAVGTAANVHEVRVLLILAHPCENHCRLIAGQAFCGTQRKRIKEAFGLLACL